MYFFFQDLHANPEVVRNLASIFVVRKELTEQIKKVLLPNTGLTIEEADLLINLYGAKEFHWEEPPADAEGFVLLKNLQTSLVHSPTLLSRRLGVLEMQKLVESISKKELDAQARASDDDPKVKDANVHASSRYVRISLAGIEKIRPIWDGYVRMASVILAGVLQSDLDVHLRVNKLILERLRTPYWTGSPKTTPPAKA